MSEGKDVWEGRSNWESPSGRKSPKWRSVSLTNIRETQGRISDGGVALRVAQRAITDGQQQLKVEIAELFAKTQFAFVDPNDIALGWWECLESPTLNCIYDNSVDRDHDYCLICDKPHERK